MFDKKELETKGVHLMEATMEVPSEINPGRGEERRGERAEKVDRDPEFFTTRGEREDWRREERNFENDWILIFNAMG